MSIVHLGNTNLTPGRLPGIISDQREGELINSSSSHVLSPQWVPGTAVHAYIHCPISQGLGLRDLIFQPQSSWVATHNNVKSQHWVPPRDSRAAFSPLGQATFLTHSHSSSRKSKRCSKHQQGKYEISVISKSPWDCHITASKTKIQKAKSQSI